MLVKGIFNLMKSFAIIGLGNFGQTLATTLADAGAQVLAIGRDPDTVNSLGEIVTNAILGDPTNEEVLKSSGINDYDCAVVCIADNISDSLIVTIILKELGVKKIVARAGSVRHRKILEKIGADLVVFPENDMGEKLAHKLINSNVIEFLEYTDGYSIAEIKAPDKWIGRSLVEIDIRRKHKVTVIAVKHGDGTMDVSPTPDMVFAPGDVVSVMGEDSAVHKLAHKI